MLLFSGADRRRAAQYLVTIVAVLLVGYLISILPVMVRLEFTGGLLAADLILFVSRMAALVLFIYLPVTWPPQFRPRWNTIIN